MLKANILLTTVLLVSVQIIATGPGHTLTNFVKHLNGLAHRMQMSAGADQDRNQDPVWHEHSRKTNKPKGSGSAAVATQASEASSAGKASKAYKTVPKSPKKRKAVIVSPAPEDAVASFLEEMGLSRDLAEVLRDVGIKDEARMKALGRLSDTALDRLEKSLAEKGLDVSACLLVREGLKQRATAA